MLEFFRIAEANRNPNFKTQSLVEIMETAAKGAGWHLVFVPNLRSKNKYQVRYEKPFSSEATAELICRCKFDILKFLNKREIDYSSIDSHLGWAVYNFIKSYKPEVHNTEAKIKAAVYQSVMNKVDQSQRKEIFKYDPSYTGNQMGNRVGKKARYVNTAKVSHRLEDLVGGSGDDQDMTYSNFIGDETYAPDYRLEEVEDQIEEENSITLLINQYAKTQGQRVLLELLIEAGSDGKVTLKSLKTKAKSANYQIIWDEAKSQLEVIIGQQAKPEEKAPEITDKMVEDRVERMIKAYYRHLKKVLMQRL